MVEDVKTGEWDDEDEDEYEIPPRKEEMTPEGLKKVTECSVSEAGYLLRRVTLFKVQKVTHKVPKGVAARKKWKKFGECAALPPGPERGITEASVEEINMEWVQQEDEEEKTEEDTAALAQQRAIKEMRMRRLQERIRERSAGIEPTTSLNSLNWAQEMSMKAASASGVDASAAKPAGDKWVPQSLREKLQSGEAATASTTGYQRDDSATVRVSNISASTSEDDLQELFRPFGQIRRVYLSKDRQTGESKGFAYVAFYNISDAQECINKLNGFPYDHLILQIEWAKPSEHRNPAATQFAGYTRA